jgi:UPF0755 protein
MEQRGIGNHPVQFDPKDAQEEIKLTPRNVMFGVWSVVRVFVILACSVMLVAALGLFAYQYVDSHFISPPGADAAPPQEIIIAKGSSITKIAQLLEDKKFIRSAQVFKYYVDFSGYGNRIQAGRYVLDGSMTLDEIMEKLAAGSGGQQVTTFTITEGSTIEQTAAQLQNQKILTDTKKFLELCKTGKEFTKYGFVKDAIASKNSSKRFYMLEGYLFPAKYEIYVGATEEEIIDKMLQKTASLLTDSVLARMQQRNMTTDQAFTLASMIEEEGKTDSFKKVSAVFHNRLKKDMLLQSDVTVAYAVKKNGLNLTSADLKVDSPYNTRKYKGLPLGPISNPGEAALDAALGPDEQTMKDGYLFFYVTDPEKGTIEFYKTNAAFEKGIEKAKPVWDAYRKKHNLN